MERDIGSHIIRKRYERLFVEEPYTALDDDPWFVYVDVHYDYIDWKDIFNFRARESFAAQIRLTYRHRIFEGDPAHAPPALLDTGFGPQKRTFVLYAIDMHVWEFKPGTSGPLTPRMFSRATHRHHAFVYLRGRWGPDAELEWRRFDNNLSYAVPDTEIEAVLMNTNRRAAVRGLIYVREDIYDTFAWTRRISK